MKNSILRKTLEALAHAPALAAQKVLDELPDNEKPEAEKLFAALDIKTKKGEKNHD